MKLAESIQQSCANKMPYSKRLEERTDTDVALDATQVPHTEQTGFLEGAVQFEPEIRFQYTHCICTSPYTS
jgi:hypothetical protein